MKKEKDVATLVITRAIGTGSSATEPRHVGKPDTATGLETVLPENAHVAVSGASTSGQQLVMTMNTYAAMIAELRSDRRWAELLSDPSSFDILDRMADEALAEDDAGLTLDLDDLLS